MSKDYGKIFAKVYNNKWTGFAQSFAPLIHEICECLIIEKKLGKTILDICCGTGHFLNYFLIKNYEVTGIDLSEHMINHAIENNLHYVKSGKASFHLMDASSFVFNTKYSCVLSLYDSLNH